MDYSILMSVYYKEDPLFFEQSMDSMLTQSTASNDFVLVCDGPLTPALDAVIARAEAAHADILHVIRLEKNMGLGSALNAGLASCKNEFVARMDSDDISLPRRCETQLALMCECPELALTGSAVTEFCGDTETGRRAVPLSMEEICAFSRKRNPFNHPSVMFRKSSVLSAGGYCEDFPLFEDYYLWVRMLKNGAAARNLPDALLKMRVSPDMYMRRGGRRYAADMLRFHRWLRRSCWSSAVDFCTGALPHALVCFLPSSLRRLVYKLLRS